MRRLLTILLLGIACTAASPDAGPPAVHVDTLAGGLISIHSDRPAWRDSLDAWSLVEDVRYGSDDGTSGELIDPMSFTASDDGHLYVVDRKPPVVKVYAPDGSFVRTFGREGSGPGEFRVGFIAVRGDRIALHDPEEGRTTVFDTSGTLIKSAVTFCCIWGDIVIDTAMRIVIPAFVASPSNEPFRGSVYVRYRTDLTPVDTLLVPGSSAQRGWTFSATDGSGREVLSMRTPIPLLPRAQHTLHPWGGVVRGVSDQYRLVRAPTGSDSTWVASRAWTGDRIPDPIRKARLEVAIKSVAGRVGEASARQTARLDDIPSVAPAYTRLGVDEEGNIWLWQLLGSDSTQTTWDVLDARGAWLGTTRVAYATEERGGVWFGRGAVYLKTESEDGRPVIVRLKVGQRR